MEEKTSMFGNLKIVTDGYTTKIFYPPNPNFAIVVNGMEYDVDLVNLEDKTSARLVYENCPVRVQTWRQLNNDDISTIS